MITDRFRFSLTGYPLPKGAIGKTFFAKSPGYARLQLAFGQLLEDRGLGLLTADAGVGKTAAMRNLCTELPRPDHIVLYLCGAASGDLLRTLAFELGIRPPVRRTDLWVEIKKTLVHILDEKHSSPVVVVDEAQSLPDAFLTDLTGFLNFAFDSRELVTLWLVGLPAFARRLHMQAHAALRSRVSVEVRMDPFDRETFVLAVTHAFSAAGATQKVMSDEALELLFRSSRGVLRNASKILRVAMRLAAHNDRSFIDEATVKAALAEVGATS